MMTCADAGTRIDAFIDGELPPSESVEVARHVSVCALCDRAVQRLLTVRDALAYATDRALAEVDLSTIWPRVERAIEQVDGQAAWRRRGAARRRVPGLAWGAIAAIAAGTMLFLRPVGGPSPSALAPLAKDQPATAAVRVAAKRLPNHVYIDRLAGKDIALRRESKSGTTMIWVNHEVESSGW
jgi:anti-sigma factor RsiW